MLNKNDITKRSRNTKTQISLIVYIFLNNEKKTLDLAKGLNNFLVLVSYMKDPYKQYTSSEVFFKYV